MVHVHAPRKICLELRECDLLKDERVSELENVLSDATQCMKPLKILTPELSMTINGCCSMSAHAP